MPQARIGFRTLVVHLPQIMGTVPLVLLWARQGAVGLIFLDTGQSPKQARQGRYARYLAPYRKFILQICLYAYRATPMVLILKA